MLGKTVIILVSNNEVKNICKQFGDFSNLRYPVFSRLSRRLSSGRGGGSDQLNQTLYFLAFHIKVGVKSGPLYPLSLKSALIKYQGILGDLQGYNFRIVAVGVTQVILGSLGSFQRFISPLILITRTGALVFSCGPSESFIANMRRCLSSL